MNNDKIRKKLQNAIGAICCQPRKADGAIAFQAEKDLLESLL